MDPHELRVIHVQASSQVRFTIHDGCVGDVVGGEGGGVLGGVCLFNVDGPAFVGTEALEEAVGDGDLVAVHADQAGAHPRAASVREHRHIHHLQVYGVSIDR